MNTNSNTYTVVYSTILVVVVAAVLAFAAEFLKPAQEENIKKDTISQILTAADIKFSEGDDVLEIYQKEIDTALVVKADGTLWKYSELNSAENLEIKNCSVYDNAMLKKQINASDKKLPVYIFKNGVTVIPCYGAGLWGPIWGYIGLGEDLKTIKAVCFGHKGETPGLGAKISDEPSFAESFKDKEVGDAGICFEIVKPGKEGQTTNSRVDAISGATITCQALGKTLDQWFGFYQNYFKGNGSTVKPANK